MTAADTLRTVALFRDLDADSLALVAGAARRVKFPKGSVVFQEGDPGDYLLIVEKGQVKVVLLGDDGQETIINLLDPPALLGEIALLDDAPRSATVIAVTATEFLQIARGPFLALIKKHPALALEIMAKLARGLRKATEQVRSLSMFDVHGRMLRALLIMAQERGESNRSRMVLRPHPAVKDLALMCGCTREAASRALKTLHTTGYVSDAPDGLAVEGKAIRKYLQPTLEHLVPLRRPRARDER
jgi:CRP/FNR family transcriptional regulator, cyclic AMP receptor protein